MASKFKKYIKGLFLCAVASLIINTGVFALDRKTSSAISHYIMAVIYEDLGKIDQAIQEYKKALRVDYRSSVLHLNLASNYIKKNNILEAIEELNLAVKFNPEAVEPHAILALLYSSQNKLELAQAEYEIALKIASKLEPKNIDIYKSLGAIYIQQKKFKDAEGVYRLILDLAPGDSEAHFYLGNVYNELKNIDGAIKELNQALGLRPDYHQALNYLAYLYVEENKNLVQAEIMLRKALEIEPNNGAYIDSLGWLYFKQGKFKEAIKELEKASTLLADPVIYEHLGDVYLNIADIDKAKLNWQKSLELEPNQARIKEKLEKLNK